MPRFERKSLGRKNARPRRVDSLSCGLSVVRTLWISLRSLARQTTLCQVSPRNGMLACVNYSPNGWRAMPFGAP